MMRALAIVWTIVILGLTIIAARAQEPDLVAEIERAEALFQIEWHISAPIERGFATWYGPTGRKTANGEHYNGTKMTCAHPSLPFDTIVRVTVIKRDGRPGRSVRCRVNDRGPFVRGVIIDLSPTAARGIGLVKAGKLRVKIEVVK